MDSEAGFQVARSAPERYEVFVAPIMAPFVDALLDQAVVGSGSSVLDVACGTGFVARAAAGRVGPTSRVVGVDVNSGMLQLAAKVGISSAPTIEWGQASADRLPMAAGEFDAVLCQQGLQFFPDRQAAVDEMSRVTRPGGRVAVTVWSPMHRSPYMEAQFHAVAELLGAEASASLLDAFACSADAVGAAFRAAGLHHVEDREVVANIRLESVDRFLVGHLSALPWGAAITDKHPNGLQRAATSMKKRLAADIDASASLNAVFASVLVSGVR
jgi:SAM-dependent methyltransferase